MSALYQPPALWIALLPLGGYLSWLAWAHLRRRPLAVSGVFDVAMLAVAVSGLAVVGPLALIRPVTGGTPWSWPVLAFLFALMVAVCMLVARPRMVVYNISVEQFRPLVAEVVAALDPEARWAGESAALPGRGFQLHIEGNGPLRTVSVVNIGERSSAEGWGEFTRRLRRSVRTLRVRRSPWGGLFACLGLGLIATATLLALGPHIPADRDEGASVESLRRAAPPAPTSDVPMPGAIHAPPRRPVRA